MKLSAWTVLSFVALTLATACSPDDTITMMPRQDIEVLDGDTLIFEGKWVRIRGIDTPELGPWADCWSEAALGGVSREALEGILWERGPWKLSAATPAGDQGMVVADVLDREGDSLADAMHGSGYAAKTSGRWDWCGMKPNRQVLLGDPKPHGPQTWWPSNHMYDARAGD